MHVDYNAPRRKKYSTAMMLNAVKISGTELSPLRRLFNSSSITTTRTRQQQRRWYRCKLTLNLQRKITSSQFIRLPQTTAFLYTYVYLLRKKLSNKFPYITKRMLVSDLRTWSNDLAHTVCFIAPSPRPAKVLKWKCVRPSAIQGKGQFFRGEYCLWCGLCLNFLTLVYTFLL